MPALDGVPLPPVNDASWEDWAGALDADARALNARPVVYLVVKATEPVAADYGLATIPVGAVWIQSP